MTTNTPDEPAVDTVVLIHGLWMLPLSWDQWVERYTRAGFKVLAPAWPGLTNDVAAMRDDPSPLAGLGVKEIVDHYDQIIRELQSRPIIMGHSFGGLITQVLLSRGLGAAGVSIASAPAKGVFKLPFSSLRTAWPALRNPANRKKSFTINAKQFHYRFTNTLPKEESDAVYERLCIPGSGRMLFQAGLANFTPSSKAATFVDYQKADRAPLLFIAGGKDHVAPAGLNRSNFKKYRKSPAVTVIKEYPDRTHYTAGDTGWEEVADYALEWATKNATT